MLLHSALVAAIVTTTAAIDHAAATSENESALKGRNLRTSTSGGKPSSSETKIDSIRKDNVKGDVFRIEAIEDDFDVVAGSGTVDLDVLLNDKLYRSDSMRDRDYMVITAAEGHDATGKDVCRPSGNHNVVKFDLKEADIGWNHCQYKVCYDDPRQASDEKLCDIARVEVYVEKKSRTPVPSPVIRDDKIYIEEGVKTRVYPLDNDTPGTKNSGPLEINGLLRVKNLRLPTNLDEIQSTTADLVLDRTIYKLQTKTDSIEGGVCRRTGNKEDVQYDPPRNFIGLDGCVYEAIDEDGETGIAVIFFEVQSEQDFWTGKTKPVKKGAKAPKSPKPPKSSNGKKKSIQLKKTDVEVTSDSTSDSQDYELQPFDQFKKVVDEDCRVVVKNENCIEKCTITRTIYDGNTEIDRTVEYTKESCLSKRQQRKEDE